MKLKPEETVDYNIKVTWHAISRMYNEQASKHGSTMAVGYVLLHIDPKDGTPATKIGPMLGMEATSLTRMLRNLEENKMIVRIQDKNDKRSVRIHLTEQGKESREIARKVVKKFNEAVRQSIPREKLNTFFEVMEKINIIIADKNIY